MAGKKGMTHYSVETKEQAVKLFLEGQLTMQAIAERFEIRDPERLKKWVQAYRREGPLGLRKAKGRPRKRMEGAEAELARLRMENDLLKKLHAELRKAAIGR
jgi:transposase-like protein